MDYWSEAASCAPSTAFPAATIWVTCRRQFRASDVIQTVWDIVVSTENGNLVESLDNDVEESSFEEFLRRLASFYDGSALWTRDETGYR